MNRFPTSTSLDALASSFRDNARRFVEALRAAGATVKIAATYRPPERAYLMHYSFRIAKQGLDPQRVPAYPGVDIEWCHRSAAGEVDLEASRRAAREMVQAYAIVRLPALASRHTEGLAVDMSIRWQGSLKIKAADDAEIVIEQGPNTGDNVKLQEVGATYNLYHKVPNDPPHWSSDGR
ncbi:peptidoglycan-binding domain-containing protein [Archangium minus]|uniref:Peptidoglycan-binding domain-containing protein n=1 Tax=Archangium minus TaxID=83450 RepID=A0ABY9WXU3_9BACT|nr:peptidoglycan-binding domain-containing protein [Archangium minus]